jgi:hypothetical protein
MVAKPEVLDIHAMPELRSLVEEVRSSRRPRLLRDGDIDLALLSPVRSAPRRPSPADEAAFRSSAGGLRGLIDPEIFKREVKASRSSDRSTVYLLPS